MPFAVELVSPSQRVWSGQAEMVSARTIDGDLGILSGHTQLFGVLVDGTVTTGGSGTAGGLPFGTAGAAGSAITGTNYSVTGASADTVKGLYNP